MQLYPGDVVFAQRRKLGRTTCNSAMHVPAREKPAPGRLPTAGPKHLWILCC